MVPRYINEFTPRTLNHVLFITCKPTVSHFSAHINTVLHRLYKLEDDLK